MTDKIESKGKTVEDAVNEALLQMGARRNEVNIEVLDEPKSGLFGLLGAKQARVLVTRREARGGRNRQDFRDRNEEGAAHDLGGSGSGKPRGDRGRRGPAPTNQDKPAVEGGRDAGRGGRGGGRGGSRGGSGGNREGTRDGVRSANQDDNRRQGPGRSNAKGPNNSTSPNNTSRPAAPRDGQSRDDRPKGDRPRDDRGRATRPRDERPRDERPRDDRPRDDRPRDDRPSEPARDSSRRRGGRSRRNEGGGRPRQETNTQQVLESRNLGPIQGAPEMLANPEVQNSSESVTNTLDLSNSPDRSNTLDRPDRSAGSGRSDRGRGRGRGRGDRDNRPEETNGIESDAVATPELNMTPDEIVLTGLKATDYAEPLRNVTEDGLDQALADITNGMLLRAGFPVRCEVKSGEYKQVRIVTDDSSAGMLIGRHGATVDSVEHLVDRMAGMAMGDRVRMNLDINNYRRRREEALHERVLEVAGIVLGNGRTYHMEPMCARERRIVHLQVESVAGVRTFTMGGGAGKHVVLAPEDGKSPEAGQGDNGLAGQAEDDFLLDGNSNVPDDDFGDDADGPQPLTNDLVVDDDEHRPLI